jgi:hypothetical protein
MKRVRMPLMPHEAVEYSGSMDALPAGTSSSQAAHGVAAPYSDLVRLQEERDAAQDRLVHLCRQRDLLKIRVADATAQIRRLESCLTSDLTELSPAGIELVEAAFQPAISQVGPQDNSDAAAAADQAQDDYAAVMAATEDCVAHYGMPSSLVSSPIDPSAVVARMAALVDMLQQLESRDQNQRALPPQPTRRTTGSLRSADITVEEADHFDHDVSSASENQMRPSSPHRPDS